MKNIKGASVIEQACSTITTIWREGYNPETVKDDLFMSMAIVKNRFGSQWKGDFSWHGPKGIINEISDEQRDSLERLKAEKKHRRATANNGTAWG
jgi:hypothetical protein